MMNGSESEPDNPTCDQYDILSNVEKWFEYLQLPRNFKSNFEIISISNLEYVILVLKFCSSHV